MALILGANQSTKHKTVVALLFLIPVIYHSAASSLMGDQPYYVSAGVVGMIVTGVIIRFGDCDELAIAAWTSIFINLFGIITWFMGQDPGQYDRMFLLFWGWVLWILFRGSIFYGMAGNLRMLYSRCWIHRDAFPRLCLDQIWIV